MASGGLEGVVVAETRLSQLDGAAGRLVIRGRSIEELTGRIGYEEMCALLWHEDLAAAEALRHRLGGARRRAYARLGDLGQALATPSGMDALRAAMAHLSGAAAEDPVEITAAVGVFAAAWVRRARGFEPLPPDPARGHAEDVLRMIHARVVEPARVAALDAYLVTAAEHGMNASTFTARVVASTGSDRASAVVAAIGALKGPLHGGAPGPVLDMLDAIGAPEHAEAWLLEELAAGRRVMGLGHRVYRVRDPRAAVFERAVERLRKEGVHSERLELAQAVERIAVDVLRKRHPGRNLDANVEFYTAVLLDAVGLPRALFTPIFAVARVAGWLAHVAEQRESGRLIRPTCRYVGPLPPTREVA